MYEKHVEEVEKALDSLKLRDRKNVERKIKAGVVKYDKKLKKFIWIHDEAIKLDQRLRHGAEADNDSGDEDFDSADDQDHEEQKIKEKINQRKKEVKKPKQDDDN
jgi:hypothetical protein